MDRPPVTPALSRLLPLFLAVVAACSAAPPQEPTPTAASLPTATSAGSVLPSSPAVTPTPGATPTDTPLPATAAPTPSPTAAPTVAPTGGTVTPQLADGLQGILDAERARRRIPGINAAVIMPDGSRWLGVSGDAATSPERPVDKDTPFIVGSITKTFITALTMELYGDGVIDIDAPLSAWLPDFPRADQITPRQLLSHTSGVFNYFEHGTYNRSVFGNPDQTWQPQEILDRFVAAPYCAPGTCYHYSNTGFVLLGMMIERATGQTVHDLLAERFFERLGMDDTFFQDADNGVRDDSAEGHLYRRAGLRQISDGSGYRPTRSAATVAWTAGGLAGSADDIATWCRALYGGSLLDPELLAEMTDFGTNFYAAFTYGLGTRTRLLDGRREIGHTGSLRGFTGAMWHMPAENITVVVLTNLGRIDPLPISDRLARLALLSAGYAPPATPVPEPSVSPLPLP